MLQRLFNEMVFFGGGGSGIVDVQIREITHGLHLNMLSVR